MPWHREQVIDDAVNRFQSCVITADVFAPAATNVTARTPRCELLERELVLFRGLDLIMRISELEHFGKF